MVVERQLSTVAASSSGLDVRQRTLLNEAWIVRQANFPSVVRFDYPLNTLVVSQTGTHCELDCAHCGGRYLRHMVPIWEAQGGAATSCLISGGCDRQGRVPVSHHLDKVMELRSGRVLNWHVGLIDQMELQTILPLSLIHI